jgi:arrestin-related trafficking adapter 3/6
MSLAIRLTEPVVFLRGDHSNPKRGLLYGNDSEPAPPAIVRGLLVLTLDKPTKISSIEVEIEGKCTSEWIEGGKTRRVETEDHRILHAKATFFNAAEEERERLKHPTPGSDLHARRHVSVGPGLAFDRSAPRYSDSDSDEGDSDAEVRRGRDRTVTPRRTTSSRTVATLDSQEPDLTQLRERYASVDPYQRSHYPSIHTATVPEYSAIRSSNGQYIPRPSIPSIEEFDRQMIDNLTDANTRANGEVMF